MKLRLKAKPVTQEEDIVEVVSRAISEKERDQRLGRMSSKKKDVDERIAKEEGHEDTKRRSYDGFVGAG